MSQELIVVIDSDTELLHLMGKVLAIAGYQSLLLRHEEATAARIAQWQPQVVVLELRQNFGSVGWPLCDSLRAGAATSHIPVLYWSTDSQLLQEGGTELQHPGCDTLAKPFDLDVLLSKLARLGTWGRVPRWGAAQQTLAGNRQLCLA